MSLFTVDSGLLSFSFSAVAFFSPFSRYTNRYVVYFLRPSFHSHHMSPLVIPRIFFSSVVMARVYFYLLIVPLTPKILSFEVFEHSGHSH